MFQFCYVNKCLIPVQILTIFIEGLFFPTGGLWFLTDDIV